MNSPNWSTEELDKYCLENGIAPSTPPKGTEEMLYSYNISSHLQSRFSGDYLWEMVPSESNSVSNIYGGDPIDSYEYDPIIQEAKSLSKISEYDLIGCGPLSLITQIDFLSRHAGYTQFITDVDSYIQRKNLYIDIFNTIKTYPKDGEPATLLEMLGFTFEKGTFTFPHDLIDGANQLFMDYNINNGIGAEDVNADGSYRKMMDIRGDTLPSSSSFSSKLNTLISSIDKGMPVIWWTTNDAGDFKNHYMNIFGYEYWRGIDEKGNTKSHLFFKVRVNWGYEDVYMDSDLLDAVNCGFILFEENLPRVSIDPSKYEFPQAYNYDVSTKSFDINGVTINTNRLRTGYINEDGLAGTGDWHITMSPKKLDCGKAFLEYQLPRPINFIYFDIRFWSSSESLNKNNGGAVLEFKDQSGNWTTAIDFFDSPQYPKGLTSSKDSPNKYRYDFPYGTTEFRFISYATNPTNSSTNKGRIVIGNLGIVFDTNNPFDSSLYVTISSINDGRSSSVNTSGHAWTEIYNNSSKPVTVGKYTIPAFEAVTIGLWGNKTHSGVYYNLEYSFALTEVVDRASSSSSSSGSSSSLELFNSNNSSMWSNASSGLSSWLYGEYREACIVSYGTGRVSVTETINTSSSSLISNVVNAHNDEWWPWYNCSDLAIDIWNSISEEKIDRDWIQTPTNLMDKIRGFDDYKTDRNYFGDPNRVGYFAGDEFYYEL